MQKVTFAALPVLVQFTSLATLFVGWVLFAEMIIDRHGYDRFLPLYRVGNLCLYDVAVLSLLVIVWFILLSRRPMRGCGASAGTSPTNQ